MNNTQHIYDSLYQSAIDQGWACWGGDDRIHQGISQLERILSPSFVPKSGYVLELGCGEGHLCRLFSSCGYDVTGVDISAVAISWANDKEQHHHSNIRYLQADLAKPNFELNTSFDLIIDGNCLHCIIGDSRKIFLKNVHDLLVDNGIFFISSLCSKTEQNQILMHDDIPYRFIPTPESITNELANADFMIIETVVHQRSEYDHINLFLRKNG
jgi:SAM-dependent methyltransferase